MVEARPSDYDAAAASIIGEAMEDRRIAVERLTKLYHETKNTMLDKVSTDTYISATAAIVYKERSTVWLYHQKGDWTEDFYDEVAKMMSSTGALGAMLVEEGTWVDDDGESEAVWFLMFAAGHMDLYIHKFKKSKGKIIWQEPYRDTVYGLPEAFQKYEAN